MSTLTLSRVMIPWDWIGIVTIRMETLVIRSIAGMMSVRPGAHRDDPSEPEVNTALVLGDYSHCHCEKQKNDDDDGCVHGSSPFCAERTTDLPSPAGDQNVRDVSRLPSSFAPIRWTSTWSNVPSSMAGDPDSDLAGREPRIDDR